MLNAGPTPLVIYLANLLDFIVGGLGLARWFLDSGWSIITGIVANPFDRLVTPGQGQRHVQHWLELLQ